MRAAALLCLLAAAPQLGAPLPGAAPLPARARASPREIQVEVLQLFRPRAAVVWTAGGQRTLRAVAGGVSVDGAAPVERARFEAPVEVELAGGLRRAYAGALLAEARGATLRLVNQVALEEYVASVTGAEGPAQALPAALEALAVVVRSFALARLQAGGHLCDRTHCQLYRGRASARPQARAAAAATAGLVLLGSAGAVAPAPHHAACGGRTADATEIWPAASAAEREAAVAVDDALPSGGPACAPLPAEEPLRWSARLAEAALLHALEVPAGAGVSFATGPGGRVAALQAGPRRFSAEALQLAVGRATGHNPLRSPRFTAERIPGAAPGIPGAAWLFRGVGHGHGAGLCQRGAAALATLGYDRHLILARYFPRLVEGRADGRASMGRLPKAPESG